MSRYIDHIPTPPPTLTDEEQRRLLQVTGEHRAGFRDHMIVSLALGTGLRMHEIAALRSLASTERHTHPSIEELLASVQGLRC